MLIRYLVEYINVTHKLGKFFIQEIFISGEIIVSSTANDVTKVHIFAISQEII